MSIQTTPCPPRGKLKVSEKSLIQATRIYEGRRRGPLRVRSPPRHQNSCMSTRPATTSLFFSSDIEPACWADESPAPARGVTPNAFRRYLEDTEYEARERVNCARPETTLTTRRLRTRTQKAEQSLKEQREIVAELESSKSELIERLAKAEKFAKEQRQAAKTAIQAAKTEREAAIKSQKCLDEERNLTQRLQKKIEFLASECRTKKKHLEWKLDRAKAETKRQSSLIEDLQLKLSQRSSLEKRKSRLGDENNNLKDKIRCHDVQFDVARPPSRTLSKTTDDEGIQALQSRFRGYRARRHSANDLMISSAQRVVSNLVRSAINVSKMDSLANATSSRNVEAMSQSDRDDFVVAAASLPQIFSLVKLCQ